MMMIAAGKRASSLFGTEVPSWCRRSSCCCHAGGSAGAMMRPRLLPTRSHARWQSAKPLSAAQIVDDDYGSCNSGTEFEGVERVSLSAGGMVCAFAPSGAPPSSFLGPFAVKALQIAPPVLAQLVFLAPMQAMKDIKAKGTTFGMSPLPFSAMMTNGFLWGIYGVLLQEPTIWVPNIPGAILGAYYLKTFHDFRDPDTNTTIHFVGSAGIIGMVAAAAVGLPTETAVNAIGSAGVAVVITVGFSF